MTFSTFLWMNARGQPDRKITSWQYKYLPQPLKTVLPLNLWLSIFFHSQKFILACLVDMLETYTEFNIPFLFLLQVITHFCSDIKWYSLRLLACDSWLAELGDTASLCWNVLPYIFPAVWLLFCLHKLFKKKISYIALQRHFA